MICIKKKKKLNNINLNLYTYIYTQDMVGKTSSHPILSHPPLKGEKSMWGKR